MDSFYESDAWQGLRYRTLKRFGRKCMCCHATGVELHVDHIKPRSTHPELELEESNLQVLCRACNLGKLNRDEMDFRPNRFMAEKIIELAKLAKEFAQLQQIRVEQRGAP